MTQTSPRFISAFSLPPNNYLQSTFPPKRMGASSAFLAGCRLLACGKLRGKVHAAPQLLPTRIGAPGGFGIIHLPGEKNVMVLDRRVKGAECLPPVSQDGLDFKKVQAKL